MALTYTNVDRVKLQHPMIGSMTTLNSAQIFTFVDDAERLINSKLAKKYTVPVTGSGVPPILETLATNIGMYYILSRRVFTQEKLRDSVWPTVFKEALKTLDDICEGKLSIVNSDGTIVSVDTTKAEFWSTTKDYTPTFDEHGTYDQIQDEDKIDDLEAERDI